jgi:hypothetical protein
VAVVDRISAYLRGIVEADSVVMGLLVGVIALLSLIYFVRRTRRTSE